jgi:hypothetical protein
MILKYELGEREEFSLTEGFLNYGFVAMNNNEYRDDMFLFLVELLLPFCFVLAFLLPMHTLITKFMHEKVHLYTYMHI